MESVRSLLLNPKHRVSLAAKALFAVCALHMPTVGVAAPPPVTEQPPPSAGESSTSRNLFWGESEHEPLDVFVGIMHRGMLAESGSFIDRLSYDVGLGLRTRVHLDLSLGIGQPFKEGGTLSLGVQGRLWLLPLLRSDPYQYFGRGPYIGGGAVFKGERTFAYGTFGFGRRGFFEINIRDSHVRPLALIPSVGYRFRW